MRITRIDRITGHRIFRDFSWPPEVQDFGQFNLIYGWNGSGKTTLSGLFRYLEKKQAVSEGQITFRIDGRSVSGSAIPATPQLPPVRVFNSEFVAASVFASPSSLSPIYFLGEDTVEKQKVIEALKSKLTQASADLTNARSASARAESDLDRFCIAKAQLVKEALSSSGSNSYNNYNKADFRKRSEAIASGKEPATDLTEGERIELKHQKDASPRAAIAQVNADLVDLAKLTETVAVALGRTIVSRVIQELADDPGLSEWVRKGLTYHTHERTSVTCHFCGELIPNKRVEALEAHFNDAYANFLKELDSLESEIAVALNSGKGMSFPDTGLLYDHLAVSYRSALTELREHKEAVEAYLDALASALAAKRKQPFQSIMIETFVGDQLVPGLEIGRKRLGAINHVINKHNEITTNYQTTVAEARRRLEAVYLTDALQDFRTKTKDVEKTAAKVRELEAKPRELEQQLGELEVQIVEHRRPAEELNRELAGYLGRAELTFEIRETGYSLSRSGSPANHLSEGEKTAIAFLYFLKSLQDKEFDLPNGIVVIDDPISSLDTNSLFCAFGFMKHRAGEPGQLFVLTHSFGFFRLVKNWFNHLPKQRAKAAARPARFYMLEGQYLNGERAASLAKLDPLLHQYESEYHYLFSRVYAAASRAERTPLEECYSLPNIARRLLEAFLAFRYPSTAGDLQHVFSKIAFDPAKKARVLRFLHTYSHDGKIGDPEHDLSILAESGTILVDVLALLESEDPEHVAQMKKLCEPGEEEVVEEG